MATDPKSHAETYGLHANVAADFEDEEGPPMGIQTSGDRSRTGELSMNNFHGRKTHERIKQQINRQG